MTQEVEPYQAAPPDIFHERDPKAVIARYSDVAKAIGSIIDSQKLYVEISGRKHVRIEGWQALAAPLGIFAQVESSERLNDGDRWGYQATAVAHRPGDLGAQSLSAADAECWCDEPNWKDRADFQLRSMAQTRACAKALRLALGFVMAMAGYEATPAEEMDGIGQAAEPKKPTKTKTAAKSGNPEWSKFWGRVRGAKGLGLEQSDVHGLLGVVSMKQWLETGRTLDDAFEVCEAFVGLLGEGWSREDARKEARRLHGLEPQDSPVTAAAKEAGAKEVGRQPAPKAEEPQEEEQLPFE